MEAILALVKLFAVLEPTIAELIPIIEDLLAGKTVTSAQMVVLWTGIGVMEDLAAKKAADVAAQA